MDTVLNGVEWLTERQAAELLDVTPKVVRRLASKGRVATMDTPGMERGRRYKGQDIRAILKGRTERREPLYSPDGELNLKGHVADWVGHRFTDRLDACWLFLMAHGYLDRDVSETVRDRIREDIIRAGRARQAHFHCCDARTDIELWGEGWRETYRGE